jgi:predicted carbohydrate-binding protein with CBM5 and CBM33 domain
MLTLRTFKTTITFLLLGFASMAFGHGWIESPPSRQQHCGVEVKPDNPSSSKCNDAFSKYGGSSSHWYNFMSVVAHNRC